MARKNNLQKRRNYMTFILKREQETEELKKKHQKNKLLNEQQQENELKLDKLGLEEKDHENSMEIEKTKKIKKRIRKSRVDIKARKKTMRKKRKGPYLVR